MPNAFTALYTHLVFSTKHRVKTLTKKVRPELFAYMGGICKNERCALVDAGGVEDHVHLLVKRHPSVCESDLMRDIKANSSRWMKQHVKGFAWQDGGGGFSVGPSSIETVRAYLARQEEHHRRRTYEQEFVAFLKKYKIEYKPEYVFE